MESKDKLWKREDLGKRYLEGIRSAIPLAEYQIKVILYLLKQRNRQINNILDIGCGDGILGRSVLEKYPSASCVFLDISDTMIDAAKKNVSSDNDKLHFVIEDYGGIGWTKSIVEFGKFDLIISGFSIHHQTDKRKKEIYREIFDLLLPGGFFLNLEHCSSPTPWLKTVFDEFFIDSLYSYHISTGVDKKREEIAGDFYSAPVREANILAPVDKQCSWLKKIGFVEVDCYLKIFELCLFGGIKPE